MQHHNFSVYNNQIEFRVCPCCGMALRMSPTSKRDMERLRQLQLRGEEQDRIIRVIKRVKYPVNQGKSVS
jgi:hypothetical protein